MPEGNTFTELIPEGPEEGVVIWEATTYAALRRYLQQITPRGDGETVFSVVRPAGTILSSIGGEGEPCTALKVGGRGAGLTQADGLVNFSGPVTGGYDGVPSLYSGTLSDGVIWICVELTAADQGEQDTVWQGASVDFGGGPTMPERICPEWDGDAGEWSSDTAVHYEAWAQVRDGRVVSSRCGHSTIQICGPCNVLVYSQL